MLKFAATLGLFAASPAAARQYDIILPLPAEIVGNLAVDGVEVSVGADAVAAMVPHDTKAEQKRSASGLTGVGARPARDDYAKIPFDRMFPLVVEDVTRQWGLTRGRPVKLYVTIVEFGTANAGRAMLYGRSPDFMTGLVEVADAATEARLGLFTVKVVNRHTGWTGLLIRGGGIRERLTEEFALESARVLSGRRSLKTRAPLKVKARSGR